jgi:hypothetical protein
VAPATRAASANVGQAGVGHDDLAAAVEDRLVEEGERLLAAHATGDLLGREGHLEVLAVAVRDRRAQLGQPEAGAYFVRPASIAALPASLTWGGVGWSGSPTVKSRTRTPVSRSARARRHRHRRGHLEAAGARREPRSRGCSHRPRPHPGRALSGRAPRSGVPYFSLQPLLHDRRHEVAHPPAELEDLLHEPRGDVRVALRRHHEHGLDPGVEPAVHQGHLELVLEVRDGAKPADDDARPHPARVVHEEPGERVDLHPRVAAVGLADDPHPLLDGEEGLLLGVHQDRHAHPVEHGEAAVHDVEVPVRDRVEGPREDRQRGPRTLPLHAAPSAASAAGPARPARPAPPCAHRSSARSSAATRR